MKKLSVFFAAAALVALWSVLVGATAGHAGVQGRSGTIAFLRSDAGMGLVLLACSRSGRTGAAFAVSRPAAQISASLSGRPTGAGSPTWIGMALSGSCAPTGGGVCFSLRVRP